MNLKLFLVNNTKLSLLHWLTDWWIQVELWNSKTKSLKIYSSLSPHWWPQSLHSHFGSWSVTQHPPRTISFLSIAASIDSIFPGYPQKISATDDFPQLGQFNFHSSSTLANSCHSKKNSHTKYYRTYKLAVPRSKILLYFCVRFDRFYISIFLPPNFI